MNAGKKRKKDTERVATIALSLSLSHIGDTPLFSFQFSHIYIPWCNILENVLLRFHGILNGRDHLVFIALFQGAISLQIVPGRFRSALALTLSSMHYLDNYETMSIQMYMVDRQN